jgi:hypothetical protein
MVSSLIADLLEEEMAVAAYRPATDDWEVDCRTVGSDARPNFLLSVRHRRETRRTRVLLTTPDWRRAAKVDAATRRLLNDMDSDTFGTMFQLA